MNNLDQNIAIAEFCGWKDIRFLGPVDGYYGTYPPFMWKGKLKQLDFQKALPDYCRDLGPMAIAESKLQGEQIDAYMIALFHLVKKGDYAAWRVHTAPPAIRAKALLQTIGKWKDESTNSKSKRPVS